MARDLLSFFFFFETRNNEFNKYEIALILLSMRVCCFDDGADDDRDSFTLDFTMIVVRARFNLRCLCPNM